MKMTADEYLKAGEENFIRKEFTEAITNYDKAIELDPNNHVLYHNRGDAKSKLKQHEDAIADYDKAIELDPEDASAYYNRGISKSDLKQDEDAIADYDKAIELDPEDASAYYNRGISKSNLKQYEDAIADYDKAIELDPEKDSAYNNRGVLKSNLKQYEDAIADYDKVIELEPEDASAYYNRGISKSNLKQYKDAIADYDKAIELNPKKANAYNGRGNVYQKTGQPDKAINDFLKLVSLTQESPPKLLYKYIPINPHQLLSLINGDIYFAPYSQLNDPLECFFLNKDAMMGECLQQFDIEPRICSMVKYSPNTETSGPTLMFAHYANDHKGICVEYKVDFNKFNKKTNVSYGEVNYQQKDKAEDLKDLYMLKDPAWQYEHEFRFVRFDNKEFAAAKVTGITFGLKCPQAHRDIVRYLLPEEVAYKEMAYKGVGNKIIQQNVTWQSEKISSEEAFKLMLNEDLTHLYFYHQQRADTAKLV